MWFRKKVLKELKEIRYLLYEAERTRKRQLLSARVLEDQMEIIQKEKAQLLDRLMSQNFEKFKTYSAPEVFVQTTGDAPSDEENEDLAGEII
jgi:hypothetical protein